MNIDILTTDFCSHRAAIEQIRETVFIREQYVPVEMEWDEHDANALHALAFCGSKAIATGRMLHNGHIGRMAVLKNYRYQGTGSMILKTFIRIAREHGLQGVFLSSQIMAIGFYEKHGFRITSNEYMDAGIPHKDMEMKF